MYRKIFEQSARHFFKACFRKACARLVALWRFLNTTDSMPRLTFGQSWRNMPSSRSAPTEATTTQSPTPPVPADYGPTISAGSMLLSFVAIAFAVSGHRRAGRLEKESWFEKNFGENLRLSCRKLDKSADSLNAFLYKSAKSLDDLQDELSGMIAEIEESSSDIRAILREVDLSKRVNRDDWESKFQCKYRDIEGLLSGAQEQTNDVLLSRVVLKAKERIHNLVKDLRTKIERVRVR